MTPQPGGALFAELAILEEATLAPLPVADVEVVPAADYEADDVPVGSARSVAEETATRWLAYELELHGPGHGNPFTDVAVRAEFTCGERTLTAHGFSDGEGVYRIRLLPDEKGVWTFRTFSNARSLDSITGTFHCGLAGPGDDGPVRVHEGAHFRHADGTRFLPLGTTAYAWTHQDDEVEEQILRSLAGSPFNKIRVRLPQVLHPPPAALSAAPESPPPRRLPRLGWNLGLVSGTRDDFYGVQSSATTRRSAPGAMRSMAGMTFV
ncbi:DUF5060 domain-containing protein [Streptomyces umbrinus]|uniref:DUF5060 domain-containing protein n=1 Tax=Streptomyces umbrinus TaxID=67370 RepID=UPI0033C16F03